MSTHQPRGSRRSDSTARTTTSTTQTPRLTAVRGPRPMPPRLFTMAAGVLLPCFLVMGGLLIQQAAINAAPYREQFLLTNGLTEKRTTPRGQILDRSGAVLAQSVTSYDCWAITKVIDPRVVPELGAMLAEATGLPADALTATLSQPSPRKFLLRNMPLDRYRALRRWRYEEWNRQANRYAESDAGKRLIAEEFEGKKSEWWEAISKAVGNVLVQPTYQRVYPYGSCAGQLIGYVTERQDGTYAGGGIELWTDPLLKGGEAEVARRPAEAGSLKVHGKPAQGVRLTIDAEIQAMMEVALARGLQRTQSKHGIGILMDSQSGDILAFANVPVFDPGRFRQFCQPEFFQPTVLEGPLQVGSRLDARVLPGGEVIGLLASPTVRFPAPAQTSHPTLVVAGQDGPVVWDQPAKEGRPLSLTDAAPALAVGPFTAEGQPVLLGEWPLGSELLSAWPVEEPAALIPGTTPDHQCNWALISAVEPGSIFKPFAMLAALEHGVVTPDSTFTIGPAPFRVPGKAVTDHHSPSANETWTSHDIMVKSSNKGMAQIAWKMNDHHEYFTETFTRLHLGEKVLDLPGERTGSWAPPEGDRKPSWYPSELVAIAYGQGLITVTPLQLAAAMNVIATGNYVRPRLIDQLQDATGEWVRQPSSRAEATCDPLALAALRAMLEDVVLEGTGKKAAVDGYRVAGKTGTAWKGDGGGYAEKRYLSSFLGYGPVEAPRYTLLIMYDEPAIDRFGGSAAAPVFSELMGWMLRRDDWTSQFAARHPEEALVPAVRSEVAEAL